MFVALGSPVDVRDHVDVALRRGALAVLVDASAGIGDPRVHGIADLRSHLGLIAHNHHGRPSADMLMVGVTGTNGKTSTVQILAQAWESLGITSATVGTLGAGLRGELEPLPLTTPQLIDFHRLIAEFRDAGATAVASELSSHALAQGRVDGCEFDIAAFTNLTRDHLDYHASMADYGAAKRRILEIPTLRSAALNFDDTFIAGHRPPPRLSVVGVTTRGAAGASVRATDIRLRPSGAEFNLHVGSESVRVQSQLMGRFNVDNVAMAAAILHAQGVDASRIGEALSAVEPIPGRMQVVRGAAPGPLVIVDYAHTPDALRCALTHLRSRGRRLILVFGCTGDRDRGKRAEMGRIAEDQADLVILTDDDTHDEDGDRIVAEVLAGVTVPSAVRVQRHRPSAIESAIRAADPADVVLIAGKGHESSQTVRGRRIPSDDVAIASELLGRR